VGVNAPGIATVSAEKMDLKNWRFVYNIQGENTGIVMLEARDFGPTCPTESYQVNQWFTKPLSASIQVSVVPEFLQGAAPWGQKKYKSTNPMWNSVNWTTMAEAGCGPTSLAIIMDYVTTWDSRFGRAQNACNAPNITPTQTMDFASRHGRAADANNVPSGTDGNAMMNNLGAYWPGYTAQKLATGSTGVDAAERLLKSGSLLLFLMKNGDTYKYDAKGNMKKHHWPGHFMVLIGVNSTQTGSTEEFFISDPSRAQTHFIARTELETHCQIWQVTMDPAFATASSSSAD
jgi:hypothetical protein